MVCRSVGSRLYKQVNKQTAGSNWITCVSGIIKRLFCNTEMISLDCLRPYYIRILSSVVHGRIVENKRMNRPHCLYCKNHEET